MRSLWFLVCGLAAAETGIDAWLRYAPPGQSRMPTSPLPSRIVALNKTENSPVYTAGRELKLGLKSMFGMDVEVSNDAGIKGNEDKIFVGTFDSLGDSERHGIDYDNLQPDSFYISNQQDGEYKVLILGYDERGALYGAFEYLSRLARGNYSDFTVTEVPNQQVRFTNEWDNLDGSIERGYGGRSIFFDKGVVVQDLDRVAKYARLLASIRVNGVIINNVNANVNILSDENIDGLGRIADAMRPYGVRVGIAVNFASPEDFGGLDSYDPLDKGVIQFWSDITSKIYKRTPDMIGYLVKASSEGQPGPLSIGRTLADAANLFARAVQPHDGIVMFRAFVYNYQTLDENNWHDDRANAAVDYLAKHDGELEENIIVQIKYGPIDFQVREPASPLFANMPNTRLSIELQVTQEYLGQQNHLVYLAPLWKTILDFDLRHDGESTRVGDVVSGRRFGKAPTGSAGVTNVGQDNTWLGSHLSMANLYAYGRMAWNPYDDPESMLRDWTRLTFGLNEHVVDTIVQMSMDSWPAYENYSGNLGIQTLADITGQHYGPKPESMDNNPWGQWTRADADSLGMDRTVKNGTKFAGQYPDEVAAMFENIETTPEELLLWFHHVPYTYKLSTGKTVIQHFYDSHYAGAETADGFVPLWESLKGLVDEQRYEEVLYRLTYQAGHAIVWRDSINNFYWNLSGIPDEAGRVGNSTWRVEAEDMEMENYHVVDVNPFHTASGYKAVNITSISKPGSLTTTLDFDDGTYDVVVGFFDGEGGKSDFEIYINDKLLGKWKGNDEDFLGNAPPSYTLDGHTATRVKFRDVKIKKGDVVKIIGKGDGVELAPLDYLAILPDGVVD